MLHAFDAAAELADLVDEVRGDPMSVLGLPWRLEQAGVLSRPHILSGVMSALVEAELGEQCTSLAHSLIAHGGNSVLSAESALAIAPWVDFKGIVRALEAKPTSPSMSRIVRSRDPGEMQIDERQAWRYALRLRQVGRSEELDQLMRARVETAPSSIFAWVFTDSPGPDLQREVYAKAYAVSVEPLRMVQSAVMMSVMQGDRAAQVLAIVAEHPEALRCMQRMLEVLTSEEGGDVISEHSLRNLSKAIPLAHQRNALLSAAISDPTFAAP